MNEGNIDIGHDKPPFLQIPIPVVKVSVQTGRITDINPQALTDFGIDPNKPNIGKPIEAFIHRDEKGLFSLAFQVNQAARSLRKKPTEPLEMPTVEVETPRGLRFFELRPQKTSKVVGPKGQEPVESSFTIGIFDVTERELAKREAIALERAAKLLGEKLDQSNVINSLEKIMHEVIPEYDTANVMLLKPGTDGELDISHTWRYDEQLVIDPNSPRAKHIVDRPTLKHIYDTKKALLIPNTSHPESDTYKGDWTDTSDGYTVASYIGVPIIIEGEVIGILNVNSQTPNSLKPRHVATLQALAEHVGNAIHQARIHRKVEALSLTDTLTGLPNRRMLEERLDQEVKRAQRYNEPLSVLMLDLDDFKGFNDRHGHPKGDDRLKDVAKILLPCIRNTDLAARYGGEEFVIILPETDTKMAQEVALRVLKSMKTAQFTLNEERTIGSSFSIGIASFLPSDTTATILKRADEAQYKSKREHGKDCVTIALPNGQFSEPIRSN